MAEKGLQILAEATPHFQQLAQLVEQNLSAEDIERAKDILKIIQVNVTQEEAKSFFN